jgi:hypothetical protein
MIRGRVSFETSYDAKNNRTWKLTSFSTVRKQTFCFYIETASFSVLDKLKLPETNRNKTKQAENKG